MASRRPTGVDIVTFEKNPLDDIDNVRTVHFVTKEGKVVRQDR